jgi:acetoacetyl-CoA synthetase
MWNFLVGALTTGCTLVLYDGSPLRDPSILWKLTDDLGITIFGTSAKYIEELSVGTITILHPTSYHLLLSRKSICPVNTMICLPFGISILLDRPSLLKALTIYIDMWRIQEDR